MATLIEKGLIEMTLPERPKSKKQKYRLTAYGQRVKKELEVENGAVDQG